MNYCRRIQGIVLAGGQSLRFRSDKALANWEGKPMIRYAVDLLRFVGLEAAVITAFGRDYSFLECPVYFDREVFQGPVSGLYRAFEIFPDIRLLVLSCDMPFLTGEVLMELLAADKNEADAVLFQLNRNVYQPFPGIYAPSIARKVNLMELKRNSMQELLDKAGRIVQIDAAMDDPRFVNVNRKEFLQR